jgi:hypothetical protein
MEVKPEYYASKTCTVCGNIKSDLGKRSILTMQGKNGMYNYRSRRRIKETKRLKYNRLRLNKFNNLLKDKHVKKFCKISNLAQCIDKKLFYIFLLYSIEYNTYDFTI